MAEVDAALGQVIRRHFQGDAVARQDADAVFADAARRVGADFDAVVQFDAVAAIGQHFVNNAIQFDEFFFSHSLLLDQYAQPGRRHDAPHEAACALDTDNQVQRLNVKRSGKRG
ncbi:hypothetical protein D3C77_563070 [compost metagenome]